ncbi:MAG: M42 family metallopeptidase, partial [Nitrospinota bacterium]
MKEELRRLLTDLTSLQGVGGQEGPVVRYLKDALSPLADRVEVDPSGNLYAFKKGRSERTLLLIAHTDEIGCIVSGIDERGFIRFTRMGGVRDNWLPACRVSVGGVFGVVGVRPGHLMSEEEERKVLPTRELFIDVGANSREEVEALGIGIGSPITFESPLTSFHNPDLVCGKAIDDRLGCALVVLLLRELKGEQLPWSLCAAAAVQEEVGLRGARMAAERVKPECAIVLDTIAGGGTPDVDPE